MCVCVSFARGGAEHGGLRKWWKYIGQYIVQNINVLPFTNSIFLNHLLLLPVIGDSFLFVFFSPFLFISFSLFCFFFVFCCWRFCPSAQTFNEFDVAFVLLFASFFFSSFYRFVVYFLNFFVLLVVAFTFLEFPNRAPTFPLFIVRSNADRHWDWFI